MAFKTQTVLRTKIPLKAEGGKQVSPQTRVVVMSMVEEGRVKAKVADPRFPDLSGLHLVSTPGAFVKTHRGRPRKAE